jgi:hypothetical protein
MWLLCLHLGSSLEHPYHTFDTLICLLACYKSRALFGLQVLEETGIAISNVRFAAAENVVFPTGQHYVVIFMQGSAAAVRNCCR